MYVHVFAKYLKTCIIHVNRCVSVLYLQSGQFSEDMIPTVGFNMRKITKGNVTIKVSNSSTLLVDIRKLGIGKFTT